LGGRIEIADFVGPIHTNYPVTLLAEPGSALRLTVIYDRQNVAGATVARWASDLAKLCEKLPGAVNKRVVDLQALLSPPVAVSTRTRQRLYVQSQNYVPPQTDLERVVAGVWQQMFGLEQISIEENFFDLGGHSLLLVQMHSRLREALRTDFPIVTLFEHPTIQSLAEHLSAPRAAAPTGQQWRDRAERQKAALTRLRDTLKR
jgi:acyl carrier protein